MDGNDTDDDILEFLASDNNDTELSQSPSSSGKNPMEDIYEYQMAMGIVTYGFPLVVGAGTIGNVLSFLVLIRKRMRNTSVYFYLAILALTDTTVLYSSAFRTWIRVTTQFELLHVSWVGCKTLMFIFMVSTHLSAWLVVAMTSDRFIVIWCPLRANTLCDITRARIITCILFLTICLYKLHLFWTIDLLKVRGHIKCASESNFMLNTYPLLKLASYTIVPFSIVLILNILITFKLWQSRKAFHQDSSRRSGESSTNNKMVQYRITLMLLTVSFAWLTLTSPFTARSLMDRHKVTPKDIEERARNLLVRTICFLLMYMNHGINFLLYCLTGNKFRSELLDTLCLVKCKERCSKRTMYRDMSLQTTKIVLKRTNSPWDSNNML